MYKEYGHIKEKGKCEEDDLVLNEIYLGNYRAKTFTNFVETDNYIYYLSSNNPEFLVRVNKNEKIKEFTIIGFNPDKNTLPTSHSKIVVETDVPKITMFGELHQTKPVITSTFDSLTATWDVRYNLDTDNEPSNLTDALDRYKKRDRYNATNLENTIKIANEMFKKIRIKSQKRKNLTPNSYN